MGDQHDSYLLLGVTKDRACVLFTGPELGHRQREVLGAVRGGQTDSSAHPSSTVASLVRRGLLSRPERGRVAITGMGSMRSKEPEDGVLEVFRTMLPDGPAWVLDDPKTTAVAAWTWQEAMT